MLINICFMLLNALKATFPIQIWVPICPSWRYIITWNGRRKTRNKRSHVNYDWTESIDYFLCNKLYSELSRTKLTQPTFRFTRCITQFRSNWITRFSLYRVSPINEWTINRPLTDVILILNQPASAVADSTLPRFSKTSIISYQKCFMYVTRGARI